MTQQSDIESRASKASDIYAGLENEIFNRIVFYLDHTKYKDIDVNNVIMWQAEQLAKMNMLTKDVISIVSQATGVAEKQVESMVIDGGYSIQTDITSELKDLTGKTNLNPDNSQLLNGLLDQAKTDLGNVVNQTLLTRNVQNNSALRTYQNIINKSTAEVITGLKTHNDALFDNIEKSVASGLPTNLVDKAGRRWSLEGYTNTVLQSTAHNTYNQVRLSTMSQFDVKLATMSSHASARPACAPIQGRIVNLIPAGSKGYVSKYDSIYNHDYGKASGTQGANCRHILTPYLEGVSSNPYTHPDTREAIENGKIQQKQRSYERTVRMYKKQLAVAEQMNNTQGIAKFKGLIADNQARLRSIVKDNSFLYRDYSREKIASV